MNKDTYTAQRTTWAHPSDRQLEAFFRDSENFSSGIRVSAIIYAIGAFDSEVDWDRGLWIYEWIRPTIRIRVTTRSAYVEQIELMSHESGYGVDDVKEILWRTPKYSFTHDSSA